MKNRIKFFVIALIYSVLANYASGQVNYASNVSKRITETKVYITYDLFSTDGAKYFNVELKLTYANNQRIIPKTIM